MGLYYRDRCKLSLVELLKGHDLQVLHYEECALHRGQDAKAIAIIQLGTGEQYCHGVGIHANIVSASLLAVLGALNHIDWSIPQSPIIEVTVD
jgi:hypothetical protein